MPFGLFWVVFKASLKCLMVYEGWPLVPLPLVSLWAHYLISFVETVERHVCDLTSLHFHAKCTLEYFCDECNELVSFWFGLWFYSFSPMSENYLWYVPHTFATLPLYLSCFFSWEGKNNSVCLPSMRWANSVVLFYGLGLRAASALNTNPWSVRLMRNAKWLQARGSGLCCGEKLGKIHHQEH